MCMARLKTYAYKVQWSAGKFVLIQDYGERLPSIEVAEFAAKIMELIFVTNSYMWQTKLYIDFHDITNEIIIARLTDDIFRVNVFEHKHRE